MWFIFHSRKIIPQIIFIDFHLILFKIFFVFITPTCLQGDVGAHLSPTSMGLDYQQGHTGLFSPQCLWNNAGHIHPFPPVSPEFICVPVIQPPGWAVSPLSKASSGLPGTTSPVVPSLSITHQCPTCSTPLNSSSPLPARQPPSLETRPLSQLISKDNLYSLCGISLTYYSIWWRIRNIWLQILPIAGIKMCYYCANIGKEKLESKRYRVNPHLIEKGSVIGKRGHRAVWTDHLDN